LGFGGLEFGREIADGAIVHVLSFILGFLLGCLLASACDFEVIGPPAARGKGGKVLIGFGCRGRGDRSRLKYRIRIARLTRIYLGLRPVQERL
jgi:hypothetical protein